MDAGDRKQILAFGPESDEFSGALSLFCERGLAVELTLTTGIRVGGVLRTIVNNTLIYERWDEREAGPSGEVRTVPLNDISRVEVY